MPTVPKAEILKGWIDDVNTLGKNLTSWERNYMESITEQFDRVGSLSERQVELLERIYAERT